MSRNIIFLSGVHGVGKTTFAEEVSRKISRLLIESSSNLIRKYNKELVNQDKIVEDMNKNQNILVEAVQKYLNQESTYILDGHFILLDSEYNFEKVPENIFELLEIDFIFNLVLDPEIIIERLNKRDNKKYDIDFIRKFQDMELNRAKEVSGNLKIKHFIIDLENEKDINLAIKKVLQIKNQ